ncbi:hypothetical protein BJ875DRAFT_54007 [Amylocarpus encephaloides]|uniref:Uncharacterized protein n=1 Tax=Amylocarpus encephaloides TaxID=45428 RepID=A0A9P7YHH7_9HELO|nr:hypothetical protein BJ875DRAFT_54007 [Amylocarpus encephaloides]
MSSTVQQRETKCTPPRARFVLGRIRRDGQDSGLRTQDVLVHARVHHQLHAHFQPSLDSARMSRSSPPISLSYKTKSILRGCTTGDRECAEFVTMDETSPRIVLPEGTGGSEEHHHDGSFDSSEASPTQEDDCGNTELAKLRRNYSRASTRNASSLTAKPSTPLGKLTAGVRGFWRHQISITVDHKTCRDHLD